MRQTINASNAPTPARRKRRKNGDRVNVALVEYTQHDVDDDDRGQDQQRLAGQEERNSAAAPVNVVAIVSGKPISRSAF